MRLQDILVKKKAAIISKWFDLVVETYPSDTSKLLKTQKDPFANPVGSATISGLESIYKQLIGELNAEVVVDSLDPIIRIRAVQDFTPSRATGFIFDLKQIVCNTAGREIEKEPLAQELRAFEAKVDRIGLMAFDIYMKCRETLYTIKANETRSSTYKAFQRAGLIVESEDNPSKENQHN